MIVSCNKTNIITKRKHISEAIFMAEMKDFLFKALVDFEVNYIEIQILENFVEISIFFSNHKITIDFDDNGKYRHVLCQIKAIVMQRFRCGMFSNFKFEMK